MEDHIKVGSVEEADEHKQWSNECCNLYRRTRGNGHSQVYTIFKSNVQRAGMFGRITDNRNNDQAYKHF